LLAWPPGQDPSRMSPVANAGANPKALEIPRASTGRMEYWHSRPSSRGIGLAAAALNFSADKDNPIDNMSS
jgi:hypothetical protein